MPRLTKIILNDYITYKNKTELRLKSGSVIVIRGRNLDRKDTESSNGAGKSLLASVLPSIKFNSAPLPMKVKKTPKEGFKKNTYQTLCIEDNVGAKYEIKKYFKGTARLQITKNGKDLKIKDSSLQDKSDASAELNKLLPMNEEQFYSLYYFDIKRPSAFQYGTDTQRHQFIEKLFKLDIYDQLAAEVKKDWDKSKLIIQEIEILDEQLSDKSSNLKYNPKELKEKQEQLIKKTDKLRSTVTELIKDKDHCKTFILLSNDIKEHSLDTVISKLSKYKSRLKELRQEHVESVAHNESIKSNKELAENKKRLKAQLALLSDVKVDGSVQKQIAKDRSLLGSLEETVEYNESVKRKQKEVSAKLKEITGALFEMDYNVVSKADKFNKSKIDKNLMRERIVLRDLETNLNDTLDHLKQHGEQNCPVCSTLLDEKTLQQIVEQKKENIKKSKKRLKFLDDMAEYKKLKHDEIELETTNKELKDKLKPVEHSASELEKRIQENEALLKKMRQKVMLKAKIEELPDVDEKEEIDLDSILTSISETDKKVTYYSDQKNKLEQLAKLDLPFSSLKEAQEKEFEVDSALSQYQPVLDKLQSKLSLISVNAVQAQALFDDITDLSSKISELKLSAPDFKIQSVLRKAFGPRGIRKQRVAEIGLALESTLNKYAEQVFDFKITFELVVTDTKFQILAHRNNEVSDVRKLSGAESRYFSLLLMMTLLKYTPQNLRLNVVFLDEAEASLDKAFRDRYVTTFIPLLRELVECVVVITPLSDSELFIPKATQYIAVKQGGVSTLTKAA